MQTLSPRYESYYTEYELFLMLMLFWLALNKVTAFMYIFLQDLITFMFVSIPAKTHSKIKILFHTHELVVLKVFLIKN